jgi:TrmH family RNA methyltransferase
MLPNSVKQHISKLKEKKYRNEFGEFLIEGLKGVEEAFRTNADVLMLIVEGTKRDEPEFAALIELATRRDIEVAYSGRNDIDAIRTTETYPGITAIISQPVVDADDLMDGTPVLCLDGISDPGNLGTIIRTADWFGIKHIILGPGSVDPYNDKVVRSTMGSIFRTNVVRLDTLEESLEIFKQNGYHLASFDMEGTDYRDLPQTPKVVFIFGSESHGIRPEIASLCTPYTIPQVGHAESLNVAMAAGIVMSFIS